MPLRNGIYGNGTITQKAVTTRYYTVGEDGAFFNYREVTRTETRIWTALTKAGALEAVNVAAQPSDTKATHTWSMKVENPVTQSYTVQRDYQKITTTKI